MKKCIKILSLAVFVVIAVSALTIGVFAAECNHNWVYDSAVTVKCESIITYKCSICEQTKEEPGTSSHKYNDYYNYYSQTQHSTTCKECGEVAYFSHSWTETSRVDSTCIKQGVISYSCYCGATKEESIPLEAHIMGPWARVLTGGHSRCCQNSGCTFTENESCSFGGWKVIIASTCEDDGAKTRTCTVCGATESGVISALGHSYGSWKIDTEAECEVEGYKVRSCGTCGDTDCAVIPASGHFYGSWQTVTAASCTSLGEQKRVCSECGKSETKSVAALGHKYVNNVCSVCGDDKTDETTKIPDETTKLPDETTKVPDETTKEPDETTKAPNETTSTPVKDHDHIWSTWQKVDANKHSRSCQDSDCSAKETKSHEDKDIDGKCDVCDGMYLTEVPIEKILGAALGIALALGVVYMVSVIKKSKE